MKLNASEIREAPRLPERAPCPYCKQEVDVGIEYHACPGRLPIEAGRLPIEAGSPGIELDVDTGFISTTFDSDRDVGLGVGDCMSASLTLDRDGRSVSYARGTLRLHGITAGRKDIIYHYGFGGFAVDGGQP